MGRTETLRRLHAATPVIAPSMLKCDYADLGREIERLEAAGACCLHLDVMDGHFVPNLSYGPPLIASLRERTELVFDAHLMISDPNRYLDDYIAAGCDAITFHIEAVPQPLGLLRRIRESGIVAGLSINPKTPVSSIEPYLDETDMVLVMSVEPGFGGQKFMPASLDKVRSLRAAWGSDHLISIDGGIGTATIGDAAAAGANVFVAGSAIFDTPDYGAALEDLTRLAQGRMAPTSLQESSD